MKIDIIELCKKASSMIIANPDLRFGQALTLALNHVSTSCYLDMALGICPDPFYSDAKIGDFLEFVSKWEG